MNDLIGAYRIISEAGRGTYGIVYYVENTLSGQRLALKVLHGKQEKRELEGLIRYRECRHPNLLQIHHIDRLPDGRLYYTMDAADNRASDGYEPDTLAARERVSPTELLPILNALLDGVQELHRHRLIHRDIKPDNILFVNGVPVLGDIGLMAQSGHSSLVGTPYFMPPEVISGKRSPDEASDIFAIGRVAYVALTGMEPFQYPQLPSDLPKDAAQILAFCRAANAANPTIDSCRQALSAQTVHKRKPSKRIVPALTLTLVAFGLLMTILLYPKSSMTPDEFEKRLSELNSQFSPLPIELTNAATARYEELQREKETILNQPFDGSPETRQKISALLDEKYRQYSLTDPLYRIGELTRQIQAHSQNSPQTMETLKLIQQDLTERSRLAAP